MPKNMWKDSILFADGTVMYIVNHFSSNTLSVWNRSSSEQVSAQAAFGKNNLASVTWKVRDIYTPSTAVSSSTFSPIKITSPANKPVNASSVNGAMEAVMKSAGLSKEDYFNFALAIDGNGRFHSGGGIINHDAYNWDTKDQEKLGEVIAGLNNAAVNGRRLAEVMLEQFAKETDLNLGEERKKDSFYYTCVVYNSGLSETHVNPDDIASMTHSLATIMRQRVTTESSFYELADKPKLGTDGLDNHLKALADWQFLGFEFNDLEAPWNRNKITDELSGDTFQPLSLIAEIQQAASPVSEMMIDLNRTRLEDMLSQVLEANGINLKEGDYIALILNEKGKLSIDADKSRISGVSGDNIDEIDDLLYNAIRSLTNALNSAKTPDGKPLGSALLEQFAAEKVGMANDDKKGPISFSFGHNAETERNEISKVRSSQLEAKETTTYVFIDADTISAAMNQVLEEYGLLHRSRSIGHIIDVENKKFSFDRDRCWINGLDDKETNEILSKIESKLDLNKLVGTFESSKPVRDGSGFVHKLDDIHVLTDPVTIIYPDVDLYPEGFAVDYSEHLNNCAGQLAQKGIYLAGR